MNNLRPLLSLTALLAASVCYAGINEQFDATCRITAATAKDGKQGVCFGTGCTIRATESYVAVMTNAHVVGTQVNVPVTCEFWSRGYQSGKLPGQVFVSDPAIDAAIVLVPTPAFHGILPLPLPFARQAPQAGDMVLSVGCANGGWASGWKGHVLGYKDGMMWFVPPPADGRSGSAITNEAGEIVALLRVRMGDDSAGGAVDLDTLKGRICTAMHASAATFRPCKEVADVWVQCPGGCCPGMGGCPSCPGGSCPIGGGCPGGCCPQTYGAAPMADEAARSPYLFPRLHPRYEAELGIGLGQVAGPPSPYQTGPYQVSPSPIIQAPSTDLSPVIGAIDRLQDTLRSQQQPGVNSSNADPGMLAMLSRHEGEIGGIRNDVQQLRGAIEQTHESLQAINKAVAPLEMLERKIDQLEFWQKPNSSQLAYSNSADDPTAWIKHSLLAIAVVIALASVALVVHAIHAHKAAVAAGQPDPLEKQLDALTAKLQNDAKANSLLSPAASASANLDALVHKLLDNQTQMSNKMVDMALQTPTPGSAAAPVAAPAAAPPPNNVVNVHAPTA